MNLKTFFLMITAVLTLASCGSESYDQVLLNADADGLVGAGLKSDYSQGNPINSVVLISRKSATGYGFCGGLLIGRNKVLTARHCLDASENGTGMKVTFPNKDKKATTGSSFFSSQKTAQVSGVQKPLAQQILPGTNVHDERDWNVGPAIFDIAVLVLSEAAPAEVPVFNIANLATAEDLRTGTLAAFGWYSVIIESDGSEFSELVRKESREMKLGRPDLLEKFFAQDRLKEYCKPINSAGDCDKSKTITKSIYGTSIESYKILTSSITSVCQGDSGSPLFVRTTSGQYKLLGVTSSGLGIDNKVVDKVITAEVDCSAHTWYQNVPALKNWLTSVAR